MYTAQMYTLIQTPKMSLWHENCCPFTSLCLLRLFIRVPFSIIRPVLFRKNRKLYSIRSTADASLVES